MIALASDCLLFRMASGESVPFSADMVSVEVLGESAKLFDAEFIRHAANAVFPCGSGVVWRRSALQDIGNFPTWNLVEDLQSGVEALCRGWRGCGWPSLGLFGANEPPQRQYQ